MVNGQRTVNPELASFLKAVNQALSTEYGVRYMDVAEEIDTGFDRLRKAFSAGCKPEDFASITARSVGFVRVDSHGIEGAREYNKRKAALAEFVRSDRDWVIGADGEVYRQQDEALVRLEPIHSKLRGTWGFGVSVAEGASLVKTKDGLLPATGASFSIAAAARDIGDAWTRFVDRMPEAAPAVLRA